MAATGAPAAVRGVRHGAAIGVIGFLMSTKPDLW